MQRARTELPDWGSPPVHRGRPAFAAWVVVALLATIVAAGLTYLLGPRFGFGAVLIADLAVVLGGVWWVNNQGLFALRRAGARRLARDDWPRLRNIAAGLASDLGIRPPALYCIPDGGPNALVCRARGPALAVTRALVDSFTRTELEAVVAHCLVRLASDELDRAATISALGGWMVTKGPVVGVVDDVRAAAVTRFPPAVVSALEKAEPRRGRFAAFWFVADEPTHRALSDRIEVVRDL